MKSAFLIFFLFSSLVLSAQQPEPVLGIAKQQKPTEWYIQQAKLWKQEIDKNKSEQEAIMFNKEDCELPLIDVSRRDFSELPNLIK